jgi:hypothetical protein
MDLEGGNGEEKTVGVLGFYWGILVRVGREGLRRAVQPAGQPLGCICANPWVRVKCGSASGLLV